FVCEKSVLNEIKEDKTVWEAEPLRNLADNDQLSAWRHDGFWQPMDTLREKQLLENLWATGNAPWKAW
ncbi:MAG: glucose-1-phosphate cytidylyltransferase, partial [Pseudomonadales bacterium]